MDASESTRPGQNLARFACDYCRQKKLKCSRDLPKCSTCKPWPGPCEYSRERASSRSLNKSITRRPGSDTASERRTATSSGAHTHFDSRLQNLEQTVHSLVHTTNRSFQTNSGTASEIDDASMSDSPGTTTSISQSNSHRGLHNGASPLPTSSKGTPFITIEESQHPDAATQEGAYSELRSLSNAWTLAPVDQHILDATTSFYIPSRSAGYRLISRFILYSEMSEPFYRIPSDEVLRQVVFEPHKVREKAWVVFFNYIMLSSISPEEDQGDDAAKLRRNTQLALNDSSIFLQPSDANVQALVLLAIHGEDYAAPNLSWMLLGHACRQAEAIALHTSPSQPYEVQQQRLCLFWLLFMFDKSCSLAFGRPAFLPMNAYADVPMPDHRTLLKFHPDDSFTLSSRPSQQKPSTFGANFYGKSIELSRIIGDVLESLGKNGTHYQRRSIRFSLETWYEETNKILRDIMRTDGISEDTVQYREMALGLNTFKFQYLQILVLLLKGDESNSTTRISSAREAISLLPSMVSNWLSVYNGVVWHLLYYPFTPFFVLFENIVNNHSSQSDEIALDLGLLATTATYFTNMRSKVRVLATVCSRLQKVAAVFLQLAQVHACRRNSTEGDGMPVDSLRTRITQRSDGSDGQTFGGVDVNMEYTIGRSYADAREGLAAIDAGELDVASYLEWLPADMDASWSMFDLDQQGPNTSDSNTSGVNANQERLRGNKRTIDGTFDWLSWDAFYAGADPNRSNEMR